MGKTISNPDYVVEKDENLTNINESKEANLKSVNLEGTKTEISFLRLSCSKKRCKYVVLISLIALAVIISVGTYFGVKSSNADNEQKRSTVLTVLSTTTTTTTTTTTKRPKICPHDWFKLGESCYYFSSSKLTWDNAKTTCIKENAYLVEINDKTEDDEMIRRVRNKGETFWIGLSDSDVETRFIWVKTGTRLDSGTYTNWGPEQPNDCCDDKTKKEENCVAIAAHRSYRWNDEPCSLKQRFICEM